MDAPGKDRSIIRDLALIYIALAHGTDQELSRVEVEEISRRLGAWQTQATEETVLSAIKDALEDYTEETARSEVDAAVRRVREMMDQDQLSTIVDDLTRIAMSDDKFLHEEGTFIGDLAHAWNVHEEANDEGGTPWSVLMENGEIPDGWSPLHDLALIYLHLAHRTDTDLDDREAEAISRTLNEWMPDVADDRVINVVLEAMHAYVQGPDKRLFEDSVESLKRSVPSHQRASILDDLVRIASADGEILPTEKDVIRKLSRAWEIEAQ